jgi:hypothetical protein
VKQTPVGEKMRFFITADREAVVVFEPTAAEFTLGAGDEIAVSWYSTHGDGIVALDAGEIVIHAPTGGFTRAWESSGREIHIGPESGI